MPFSTNVSTANANQEKLIRTDLWATRVKEELQEELMAQSTVEFIQGDFPDGNTVHIPTLGSLVTENYAEGSQISFQDPQVGEFTLQITEYLQSGVAVTDKMKEDAYYMDVLNSKFPQQCLRAIMEKLEKDIFELHTKQTNNDANEINGEAHRYVATGASNIMSISDILKAKLALDRANVSKIGRKAFVSPATTFQLLQIDNFIRQDTYGMNSSIKEGFGAASFIGRFYGFDFYESNLLDETTALDYVTGGNLTANLFIGEDAFMGAIRTMPDIESSRDWEYRRDIFHAVTRYGLGLYRPESLVTVLSA